jgi:hypothetical protein
MIAVVIARGRRSADPIGRVSAAIFHIPPKMITGSQKNIGMAILRSLQKVCVRRASVFRICFRNAICASSGTKSQPSREKAIK